MLPSGMCCATCQDFFGAWEGVLGVSHMVRFLIVGALFLGSIIGWGYNVNTGGLLSGGVNWMVIAIDITDGLWGVGI